jgi:hypothetical protein
LDPRPVSAARRGRPCRPGHPCKASAGENPQPASPGTGDSRADFATQPYEQLAAAYRKAGQDDDAREVTIARRADKRKYGQLNSYRWLGNWFLDWSVKYGYQTWRAGAGLTAVFVIFLVFSFVAQRAHLMVAVGDTEGLHCSQLRGGLTCVVVRA